MGRATATVAGIVGVLAFAGCGGTGHHGGGVTTTVQHAAAPMPRRPIAAELAEFNRAIAAQSCRAYEPFVFSIIRQRPPGAAVSAAECRGRSPALAALRGRRFTAARSYGTGAVLEGTGPKGPGAYAIWALDGDRRFRFTGVSGTAPPQLTAPFTRRAQAAMIAAGFVHAVGARDCAAMARLLSRRGRLVVVLGGLRAACRAIVQGMFFAPALRRSPKPATRVMGGTRSTAFVGVRAGGTFFTIVLSDAGAPGLRVLDVLPSTPVALPTH